MNHKLLLSGASVALLASAFALPAFAQSPAAGSADLPHPAHIHDGLCPEPGDVAQPLSDLVMGSDMRVGVASAVPVEISTSIVPMSLDDILSGDRSINVHESADAMDIYIACGDIGGQKLGDNALAIGLAELNGSGHRGVAYLQDNGDGSTNVQVFLISDALGETDGTGTTPDGSMAPVESMAPASMAPMESMAPGESMLPVESMAPASMLPVESMAPMPSTAPAS